MALVKIATTLFIQWKFWEGVKNLLLSPFSSGTLEVTLVILVIPFFVNLLIFWVTDNFLMRHDHHQHKRSFLINYVSKLNSKNQTNGFTNGIAPPYANGNGSIHTNGKASSLFERAKQYCSNRIDNIDSSYSKFDQIDKPTRRYNELIDNDSESDALLTGDERFDVEFTDDDCVALEPRSPRDPRLNL